jgi:hypothetical protein
MSCPLLDHPPKNAIVLQRQSRMSPRAAAW